MLGCRVYKRERSAEWFQGFWPTGGLVVPFVEMGIIEGAMVWEMGWK